MLSKELLVAYVGIAMYALCYQATVPLLPFVIESVGAPEEHFARLMAFMGVVQFVGTFVAGGLKNRLGAKPLLLLSFGSSALCYFMLARATSSTMLFLSFVPTVVQHGMLATRALITDVTTHAERATMLGRIFLAYAVGSTIGPTLGGYLMTLTGDIRSVGMLAALGSALSVVLVVVGVDSNKLHHPKQPVEAYSPFPGKSKKVPPGGAMALAAETSPQPERKNSSSSSSSSDDGSQGMLADMRSVFSVRMVRQLLMVKLAAETGAAVLSSMYPLITANHLSLQPKEAGYVLSFLGIVSALTQGFIIKPVTSRYSDAQILRVSYVGLVVTYCVFGTITGVSLFAVVLVPLTIFGALASTVLSARLTKSVSEQLTGSVIGLDMGVGVGLGIVSPLIGSWAFTEGGLQYLGLLCAACATLAVLVFEYFKTAALLDGPPTADNEGTSKDGHQS